MLTTAQTYHDQRPDQKTVNGRIIWEKSQLIDEGSHDLLERGVRGETCGSRVFLMRGKPAGKVQALPYHHQIFRAYLIYPSPCLRLERFYASFVAGIPGLLIVIVWHRS